MLDNDPDVNTQTVNIISWEIIFGLQPQIILTMKYLHI